MSDLKMEIGQTTHRLAQLASRSHSDHNGSDSTQPNSPVNQSFGRTRFSVFKNLEEEAIELEQIFVLKEKIAQIPPLGT